MTTITPVRFKNLDDAASIVLETEKELKRMEKGKKDKSKLNRMERAINIVFQRGGALSGYPDSKEFRGLVLDKINQFKNQKKQTKGISVKAPDKKKKKAGQQLTMFALAAVTTVKSFNQKPREGLTFLTH